MGSSSSLTSLYRTAASRAAPRYAPALVADYEPFEERDGDAVVRGVLHCARVPTGDGVVLAHGAGANRDSPVLRAVAAAFAARGIAALRIDLPFRQARPKGPPSPGWAPRDRDGLRGALATLARRCPGRLFLGGHSYGGRQASMLLADAPGLAHGLLLLAYPLHPPGRPERRRTGHFITLRTPTMFVHGTCDPFGLLDEIDEARGLMPAPTRLLAVRNAGHDLGVRGDGAFATAAVAELLALLG
jgi:predicted alpha/beta-hydrolase family hydrolase